MSAGAVCTIESLLPTVTATIATARLAAVERSEWNPLSCWAKWDFIYLVIPMKDKPQIITAAIANTMFAEVAKLISAGAVCTIKSLLPTVTATIATARLAAVERSEWNPLSCWAKWDFKYLVIPMKDIPQIITAAIANTMFAEVTKLMSAGAVCTIKRLLDAATAIATAKLANIANSV